MHGITASVRGGAWAFWVRRQDRSSFTRSISTSSRSSHRQREENPRNEPETQKTHQKRGWWPNRESAWRTRSTARTSLSGGTWPSRRWVLTDSPQLCQTAQKSCHTQSELAKRLVSVVLAVQLRGSHGHVITLGSIAISIEKRRFKINSVQLS